MKRLAIAGVLASVLASLVGCAYGGAAATGNKVVVLRNDMILFGLLRQAYVCTAAESGLTNCHTSDNP